MSKEFDIGTLTDAPSKSSGNHKIHKNIETDKYVGDNS
jgi:hypothetical protein